MKPYLAVYLIDNRAIGQAEILSDHQPNSIAYVCTTCGNLWGRIAVASPDHLQVWETEPVPCALHLPRGVRDYGTIPGSFLLGKGNFRRNDLRVQASGRAMESLPEAVLKREARLAFAHFERLENGNETCE